MCSSTVIRWLRRIYGNTVCEEEECVQNVVKLYWMSMNPYEYTVSSFHVTWKSLLWLFSVHDNESAFINLSCLKYETRTWADLAVGQKFEFVFLYLFQYVDRCQRCRSQDQCCCFCKALDRWTEACTCHQPSHMQDYPPSGFGDWYTEKRGIEDLFNETTTTKRTRNKMPCVCCVIKVLLQYPVDQVVDVIIHICFCVKSVASFPLFLVSFEEKMFKCDEIFLFERDHHFVAQAKRD